MKQMSSIRRYAFSFIFVSVFLYGCGGSEPGLVAHKYEGNWLQLPDFSSLIPVNKQVVSSVGTHNLGTSNYALVLKGSLKIQQAGEYRFHLQSDDGSKLIINGDTVIDNDGVHTATTVVSEGISLSQGDHELRVEYFQVSDNQTLILNYQLNSGAIVEVPAAMLGHLSSHNISDYSGNGGGNSGSGGNGGGDNGGGDNGGGDNGGGDNGGGDTGGGDTPNDSNSLQIGQQLNANEYLASNNGRYRLYLQNDGNIVLRDWDTRESLWATDTHGDGGIRLVLQSDGNLVLYTVSNNSVWSTGTHNTNADRLVLNNDGSLALYEGSSAVWSVNGSGNIGGGGEGNCEGTGQGNGVKIAFIGDTGAGDNFQDVLDLIKCEGAELTIVAGDTSYDKSKDDNWDAMVRNTLGSSDPVLIAAGNHDYGDSDFGDVRSFGMSRLNNAPDVDCSGDYAEKMSCRYKNVYIVLSAIGSSGSDSSHESYISNRLDNAPNDAWRVCAWHKNQKDMQVGGKSNEVGWTAYETCRKKGAIIATGHEHSYSRTHLLSDMSDQTIASSSSTFTVTEGATFAFVNGLGGVGVRDQERGGDWWASIYTSNQGARYGALFGTFYDDRAEFYFKNINGQVIDQFTVNKGY